MSLSNLQSFQITQPDNQVKLWQAAQEKINQQACNVSELLFTWFKDNYSLIDLLDSKNEQKIKDFCRDYGYTKGFTLSGSLAKFIKEVGELFIDDPDFENDLYQYYFEINFADIEINQNSVEAF